MSSGQPTFHHLDKSQSQRIFWLLEELQIPYNLKLHERHKSGPAQGRAPDELLESHQLGKSPQLITPDGRVLIESSAIALYLIKTYDTAKKFQGDSATGNDELRDEMLSSFANASLSLVMVIEALWQAVVVKSPIFVRWLFAGAQKMVHNQYTGPEIDKFFKFLSDELGQQDYFMGSNPGRADFMLSWPVDFCTAKKYVDLAKYPNLDKWYKRCHEREAWKRCMEKSNGYNLNDIL